MIWNILGLFLNTLTADDKYSLPVRRNLLQHFQMQLSRKQKTLSPFFFFVFAFSKFIFNFEPFEKQDDPDSGCTFQLRDSKKRG